MPARGQSKKKHHPGCFFFYPGWCFFFLLWPRAGAQRGFSFPCLSPGPQRKKKHPGWCFFFALAPCRHGASPSPAFPRGRSKKKNTRGGVFFFRLWPRAGTGLLLPLPFPGRSKKKKTPWVVFFFFALAPPKGRGAQRSATKKEHFAHPGPTAKIFLETNDAGHEQKGATTKKKHPGPHTIAALNPKRGQWSRKQA